MFAIALWGLIAACVETLECDESIGCPDGQLCFKNACLIVCNDETPCEVGTCEPCIVEMDGSVVNRCTGREGSVCVVE